MIASLKSNGKGAIILPHGVLFRGNAEGEIRRFIIGRRIIRGIIGLPPNLFFGTGIPACIIILDKGGALSSKGIFMIDAKEGFAKDGAKNRLRECDIRRIVDTWEAQVDVPHYARMVSYAEIEKNDFNLNIPRYIAPVDSEIHQDIVAHLKGGIPEADAAAYPAALFKPLRKGYVQLKGEASDVAVNLESDPVTEKESNVYLSEIVSWIRYFSDQGYEIKVGDSPKDLIKIWGDRLMCQMQGLEVSLVNAYAPYEHLMNYWAETLQDDCYLISRDGWKVELLPPAKKNASWEDYFCDLLPVEVVVGVTFAEERDRIVRFKTELEEVTAEIAAIDEKLADEEGEDEIDEDALKVERKKHDRKVKALKKSIKEANEDLIRKLVKSYGEMEEDEIKGYVVDHKWAIALTARFTDELKRVKAAIVSDVQALACRYEKTLPEMENSVKALTEKVAKHLAVMGIEL
jgi:type I restriction enzyme M protein